MYVHTSAKIEQPEHWQQKSLACSAAGLNVAIAIDSRRQSANIEFREHVGYQEAYVQTL